MRLVGWLFGGGGGGGASRRLGYGGVGLKEKEKKREGEGGRHWRGHTGNAIIHLVLAGGKHISCGGKRSV